MRLVLRSLCTLVATAALGWTVSPAAEDDEPIRAPAFEEAFRPTPTPSEQAPDQIEIRPPAEVREEIDPTLAREGDPTRTATALALAAAPRDGDGRVRLLADPDAPATALSLPGPPLAAGLLATPDAGLMPATGGGWATLLVYLLVGAGAIWLLVRTMGRGDRVETQLITRTLRAADAGSGTRRRTSEASDGTGRRPATVRVSAEREAEVRAAAAALAAQEAAEQSAEEIARREQTRRQISDRITHKHLTKKEQRRDSGRSGLTLIEVMIMCFILSVGILGAMSHIFTLSQAREQALRQASAHQLAFSIMERIQGASWFDLANQEWAAPRFATGTPVNPPLIDGAGANGLARLGFAIEPTGVPGLKVYIEYYDAEIMDQGLVSRQAWLTAMPSRRLETGTLNLVSENVVIRVLLTWNEINGVPSMRHEIFTTRKK